MDDPLGAGLNWLFDNWAEWIAMPIAVTVVLIIWWVVMLPRE